MMRLVGLALLVVAAGVAPALADDEEEFDAALRNFGLTAGAAWQCTAEADRAKVDDQVLEAFNRISQLFGTDRAFGFAAAFGAAAAMEVNAADCEAQVAAFTDGMASPGIAGGEGDQ